MRKSISRSTATTAMATTPAADPMTTTWSGKAAIAIDMTIRTAASSTATLTRGPLIMTPPSPNLLKYSSLEESVGGVHD
ncbi:MAG: hypothetical protein IKP53_05990 [Candidatus Methanomethylophilaceae archaeon]|nr:hypothetical protein [Candidatus Methanomethylophilaceae archaeon]